jgi:hypothetical protein
MSGLPAWLAIAAPLVACTPGEDREPSGSSDSGATVRLNVVDAGGAAADPAPMMLLRSGSYGDVDQADHLRQFSVYFRSIQICATLEENGSGYNNPNGCATLYENSTDEYTGMEAPTPEDRERFGAATGFTDVLSTDDRARLGVEALIPAGEYNYGIIEAHPWVKVKAQVGSDLCTRDDGLREASTTGVDGYVSTYTAVDTLDCDSGSDETAEAALVYIANANNYFRFQQPFVAADGDEVELDLAFNLDQALKYSFGAPYAPGSLRTACETPETCKGLQIPMIDMVPAPRKAGETTMVETYRMAPEPETVSNLWAFRLELYYNSADPNRAVQAVLATPLSTSETEASSGMPWISTSAYRQDGTAAVVLDYTGAPVLEFERNGAGGTAIFHCGPYSLAEGCPQNGTVKVTFGAPVTTEI